MPNQLSSNPWIVDQTSDTIVIWPHPMHKVQIEWIDYVKQSDTVEIWDKNKNLIWRARGALDLRTLRSGGIGWTEGLMVPTTDSDGQPNLASGKLIIYFE